MTFRRVVALLAAAGAVALLWAPYFSSVTGPVRLADTSSGFVSLWLGRAGVAVLVLSAALVFARPWWATATACAAVVVTLTAGIVPAWRGTACRGWTSFTATSDPCAAASVDRTATWGWGLVLLVSAAAATAPLWLSAARRPARPAVTAALVTVAAVTTLVASFGPFLRVPRYSSLGYADYVAAGPLPGASAWHERFAVAGLVLLVGAAVAALARAAAVIALAAVSLTALLAAGIEHAPYKTIGWAYWVTLAGAAFVLVLAALTPSPQWSVRRSVVSYN